MMSTGEKNSLTDLINTMAKMQELWEFKEFQSYVRELH